MKETAKNTNKQNRKKNTHTHRHIHTSGAVSAGEVSALQHEIWNDAMEDRSFVMKGFPYNC